MQQQCEPCQGGIPPLTRQEAEQRLQKVPGWALIESATKLRRTFSFDNFMQAQTFACCVGGVAEQQNHHPDICYGWGYCTVVFYTHKIGGLHENDFIMASLVNGLVDEF